MTRRASETGEEACGAKTGNPGTFLPHLRCVWTSPGQRPATSHSRSLGLNFWDRCEAEL